MPDHLLDRAGLPAGMVQFFQLKYRNAMQQENARLARDTPPSETKKRINVEAEMRRIQTFCNFVNKFMRDYPPTTVQPMDRSYGIKLVTGEQFVIGDPTEQPRGAMQASHALNVTGSPAAIAEAYGQQPNAMSQQILPPGTEAAGGQGSQDKTSQSGLQSFGD